MKKAITRIILYILLAAMASYATSWLIDPIYSEKNITYSEGECVSYRWVKGGIHRRFKTKSLYITLSNGEEYIVMNSQDIFNVSPQLVGSMVEIGSVDAHTINGGRKTAYLSVDGVLIYDNDYLIKRHFQTFGAFLIPCGIFTVLACLPHVITIVEETKKRRDRAHRKKKHQLKMEKIRAQLEDKKKDE